MLFTQQIFILNIKEDGADFLSHRCDVDKTFADKEDDLRSEEIIHILTGLVSCFIASHE